MINIVPNMILIFYFFSFPYILTPIFVIRIINIVIITSDTIMVNIIIALFIIINESCHIDIPHSHTQSLTLSARGKVGLMTAQAIKRLRAHHSYQLRQFLSSLAYHI